MSCSASTNGFLGAFERATDNLRFVQVRHEELATFMAAAHVILVLNNGDLNQVTWEQRVLTGDPKLGLRPDGR